MTRWIKFLLTCKFRFILHWTGHNGAHDWGHTDSSRARTQVSTPRFITSPRTAVLCGLTPMPLCMASLPSQALIPPLKILSVLPSSPLPYVFLGTRGLSRNLYLLNKHHSTYSLGQEIALGCVWDPRSSFMGVHRVINNISSHKDIQSVQV